MVEWDMDKRLIVALCFIPLTACVSVNSSFSPNSVLKTFQANDLVPVKLSNTDAETLVERFDAEVVGTVESYANNHADWEDVEKDIATLAAEHGGTHFVIVKSDTFQVGTYAYGSANSAISIPLYGKGAIAIVLYVRDIDRLPTVIRPETKQHHKWD